MVAQSELATADGQIQDARSALAQAQDELDIQTELRRRNPNTVAQRALEKLQVVVDGRQGALDAAIASKATQQARIDSALPAQKASAEAALAQAQVELDKTLVKAGVDGTVQQFTLRPGDVVNPIIRTGGILIPDAHRDGLVAGFNQIEAQVMKVGMIAEATCAARPFTILPMVVSEVQQVIAAGQIRPTDQLIDVQQMAVPGTITVFLEPLFAGEMIGVPPGSSCIANAYTNNHDALADPEHRHRAVGVPARRGHRRAGACDDHQDAGDDAAGADPRARRPLTAPFERACRALAGQEDGCHTSKTRLPPSRRGPREAKTMAKKDKPAKKPKADAPDAKKERTRAYEAEIARLQVEIAHLQAWVKASGARIVIIFEGRDAAGKGGMIRRFTERVSPRVFRVVALPAPTEREKTQIYIQRYFAHLPAAGEIVIFDRSWYNRPGVERVMGYCTDEEARHFLRLAPPVEAQLVDNGILLLKYFLTVGEEEQERRFRRRIDDPLRQWKLSPMDLESYRRWWDYSAAYDEMIRMTDTAHAPWWIVPSDDKMAARINCISHILATIPYERVKFEEPKLGKRQKRPSGYVPDETARNVVPARF